MHGPIRKRRYLPGIALNHKYHPYDACSRALHTKYETAPMLREMHRRGFDIQTAGQTPCT